MFMCKNDVAQFLHVRQLYRQVLLSAY